MPIADCNAIQDHEPQRHRDAETQRRRDAETQRTTLLLCVSASLRPVSACAGLGWLDALRKLEDPGCALTQLIHRRRVGDAEIPGRVEPFAGRQRDVLLFDEALREL